jgi:hypothetical protein
MTIDDIPSFDIPAAVGRLTTLWGWLGEDAAQDILDCLAQDIKEAIEGAAK